eukprot:361988-Chlamydomonas_euryale.AAC.9
MQRPKPSASVGPPANEGVIQQESRKVTVKVKERNDKKERQKTSKAKVPPAAAAGHVDVTAAGLPGDLGALPVVSHGRRAQRLAARHATPPRHARPPLVHNPSKAWTA